MFKDVNTIHGLISSDSTLSLWATSFNLCFLSSKYIFSAPPQILSIFLAPNVASELETHISSYISPVAPDPELPMDAFHSLCLKLKSKLCPSASCTPVCPGSSILSNHTCIPLTHAGDLRASTVYPSSLPDLSTVHYQFLSINVSMIS